MRSHDTNVEQIGPAHDKVTEREGALEDLSARVLADGRPSMLDAHSVVHLQQMAGNASVSRLIADDEGPDKVRSVIGSGGGEQLDATTAQSMRQRFGQDFSDVRIHRDAAASDSAKAVNAHAYTVGSHIVFQEGRYDPASESGQRTLAHELTHVVQQRSGAVDGTPVGRGVRISDPNDRYERAAAQNADRVLAASSAEPSGPTAAAPVQRQAGEEEEEQASGFIAHRQAAAEEEEEAAGYLAQRQAAEEEEEQASGFIAQRQAAEEEEEASGFVGQRQAAEEEEEAAGYLAQRQAAEEEEEKASGSIAQREISEREGSLATRE